MKYLIILSMLVLSACGVNPQTGEVSQPLDIPMASGYRPVVRSYSLWNASTVCSFRIYLSDEQELPYSSYNYDCEYSESGYITKVTISYYYTLPSVGYLRYSWR